MPRENEIVQFNGESHYVAFINHYSLDLEEEDEFQKYLLRLGISHTGLSKEQLAELYELSMNGVAK